MTWPRRLQPLTQLHRRVRESAGITVRPPTAGLYRVPIAPKIRVKAGCDEKHRVSVFSPISPACPAALLGKAEQTGLRPKFGSVFALEWTDRRKVERKFTLCLLKLGPRQKGYL